MIYGGYVEFDANSNIGNLLQASLKKYLHKFLFFANPKVTITLIKTQLTSTNPKLPRSSNLKPNAANKRHLNTILILL